MDVGMWGAFCRAKYAIVYGRGSLEYYCCAAAAAALLLLLPPGFGRDGCAALFFLFLFVQQINKFRRGSNHISQ